MVTQRLDRIAAFHVHLALHLATSLGHREAAIFLANHGVGLAVALRVLNRPAADRRKDAAGPCYPISAEAEPENLLPQLRDTCSTRRGFGC